MVVGLMIGEELVIDDCFSRWLLGLIQSVQSHSVPCTHAPFTATHRHRPRDWRHCGAET
jgi:hypothetical protein